MENQIFLRHYNECTRVKGNKFAQAEAHCLIWQGLFVGQIRRLSAADSREPKRVAGGHIHNACTSWLE